MAVNKEIIKKFCKEKLPITKEEYEIMSRGLTEKEKSKIFEWDVESSGVKYNYIPDPDDSELNIAILFRMYREQTRYLRSVNKTLTLLTVLTAVGLIGGTVLAVITQLL